MKKFYKIPVTERIVHINNKSLLKILKEKYPNLYDRENLRIELTYGHTEPGIMTPQLETLINNHNKETSLLYEKMGVPQFIIATKEESEEPKELATGLLLETKAVRGFFNMREISQEDAKLYLEQNPDYVEITTNLLETEVKKVIVKKN